MTYGKIGVCTYRENERQRVKEGYQAQPHEKEGQEIDIYHIRLFGQSSHLPKKSGQFGTI